MVTKLPQASFPRLFHLLDVMLFLSLSSSLTRLPQKSENWNRRWFRQMSRWKMSLQICEGDKNAYSHSSWRCAVTGVFSLCSWVPYILSASHPSTFHPGNKGWRLPCSSLKEFAFVQKECLEIELFCVYRNIFNKSAELHFCFLVASLPCRWMVKGGSYWYRSHFLWQQTLLSRCTD